MRHSTSVYLQRQADALLLPVYKDRYTGWSGKTFEYLASGTLVLCSPGPQEDLLPFFSECSNVIVLNNAAELTETLKEDLDFFQAWCQLICVPDLLQPDPSIGNLKFRKQKLLPALPHTIEIALQ